jgi:mono/diheme cytochrome c family protein
MVKVLLLGAVGVLALIAILGAVYVYTVTRQDVQLRVAGRNGEALGHARASRDRGEYLYQTAARCAACHASDLGGGFVLRSELVATLWGPNLTRGNPSVGSAYTSADFERAIRRGLRPVGQRLLMMPSFVLQTGRDRSGRAISAHAAPARRWRDADVGALYWCFAELGTSAPGPTCSGPAVPAR